MSINWSIPRSSQFIPTNNIVSAVFNNPIPGKYSFNTVVNEDIPLIEMKKNAVYLIERISIGGNISEENYFQALETPPEIVLKKSISRERIYPRPLPVLNYCDGAEVVAWILSNKGGDILNMTITGLLRQTAELNGILSVSLSISFTIYEITSTQFFSRFIGRDGVNVGNQVAGGPIPDCGLCGL